jgi:hypothetical protein
MAALYASLRRNFVNRRLEEKRAGEQAARRGNAGATFLFFRPAPTILAIGPEWHYIPARSGNDSPVEFRAKLQKRISCSEN